MDEHDPTSYRRRIADEYDANHRYAWPSELDLMARLTGLRLETRQEDRRQTPFTAHSTTHVSVYRKPA